MPRHLENWRQPVSRTAPATARTWGVGLLFLAAVGIGAFLYLMWPDRAPVTYLQVLCTTIGDETEKRQFALPPLRLAEREKAAQKALLSKLTATPLGESQADEVGVSALDKVGPEIEFTNREAAPADTLIVFALTHAVKTPSTAGKNGAVLLRDQSEPDSNAANRWRDVEDVSPFMQEIANGGVGNKILLLDAFRLPPDDYLGADDDLASTIADIAKGLGRETNLWIVAACGPDERSYASQGFGGGVFAAAIEATLNDPKLLEETGELKLNRFYSQLHSKCLSMSGGLQSPMLIRAGQGPVTADDAADVRLGIWQAPDTDDPKAVEEAAKPSSGSATTQDAEQRIPSHEAQLALDPTVLELLFAPNRSRRLLWKHSISEGGFWNDPRGRDIASQLNTAIRTMPFWRQSVLKPDDAQRPEVAEWARRTRAAWGSLAFAPYCADLICALSPFGEAFGIGDYSEGQNRYYAELVRDSTYQVKQVKEVWRHLLNQSGDSADILSQIDALQAAHARIVKSAEQLLESCVDALEEARDEGQWLLPEELTAVALLRSPLVGVEAHRIASGRLAALLKGMPNLETWSRHAERNRSTAPPPKKASIRPAIKIGDIAADPKSDCAEAGRLAATLLADPRLLESSQVQQIGNEGDDAYAKDGSPLPAVPLLDATAPPFAQLSAELDALRTPLFEEPKGGVERVYLALTVLVGGCGIGDQVDVRISPSLDLDVVCRGTRIAAEPSNILRCEVPASDGVVSLPLEISRPVPHEEQVLGTDSQVKIELFPIANQAQTIPITFIAPRQNPGANKEEDKKEIEASPPPVEVRNSLTIFPSSEQDEIPVLLVKRQVHKKGRTVWVEAAPPHHRETIKTLRGFCGRDTALQFQIQRGRRARDYDVRLFVGEGGNSSLLASATVKTVENLTQKNLTQNPQTVKFKPAPPEANAEAAGDAAAASATSSLPLLRITVQRQGDDSAPVYVYRYACDVLSPVEYFVDPRSELTYDRDHSDAFKGAVAWKPDPNAELSVPPYEPPLSVARSTGPAQQDADEEFGDVAPSAVKLTSERSSETMNFAFYGARSGSCRLEFDVDGYPRAIRYQSPPAGEFTETLDGRARIEGIYAQDGKTLLKVMKVGGSEAIVVPHKERSVVVKLAADLPAARQSTGLKLIYGSRLLKTFLHDRDVAFEKGYPKVNNQGAVVLNLGVQDVSYVLDHGDFLEGRHELSASFDDGISQGDERRLVVDTVRPEITGIDLNPESIIQGKTKSVLATIAWKDSRGNGLSNDASAGIAELLFHVGSRPPEPADKVFHTEVLPYADAFRGATTVSLEAAKLKLGSYSLFVTAVDHAGNKSDCGEHAIHVEEFVAPPKAEPTGKDDKDRQKQPPEPVKMQYVITLKYGDGGVVKRDTNFDIQPGGWQRDKGRPETFVREAPPDAQPITVRVQGGANDRYAAEGEVKPTPEKDGTAVATVLTLAKKTSKQ